MITSLADRVRPSQVASITGRIYSHYPTSQGVYRHRTGRLTLNSGPCKEGQIQRSEFYRNNFGTQPSSRSSSSLQQLLAPCTSVALYKHRFQPVAINKPLNQGPILFQDIQSNMLRKPGSFSNFITAVSDMLSASAMPCGAFTSFQIQNAILIPQRLLHTQNGGMLEPAQQSCGESCTREKREVSEAKHRYEDATMSRQLLEEQNQNESAEEYKAMYDSYYEFTDDQELICVDFASLLGADKFLKEDFKGGEQYGPLAEFKTVMKAIGFLLPPRIRKYLEFDGNRGSGKEKRGKTEKRAITGKRGTTTRGGKMPDFFVKLANGKRDSIFFLVGETKATNTNDNVVSTLHGYAENAIEELVKEDSRRFPAGIVVPIFTQVSPDLRFGSIVNSCVVFPESIPPYVLVCVTTQAGWRMLFFAQLC
jgi:hypothetical protein